MRRFFKFSLATDRCNRSMDKGILRSIQNLCRTRRFEVPTPSIRFSISPRPWSVEHEWEAELPSGSGKEDTAVIHFHSQREIDHRRFEGLGVVKEVRMGAVRASLRSTGDVERSSRSALLLVVPCRVGSGLVLSWRFNAGPCVAKLDC